MSSFNTIFDADYIISQSQGGHVVPIIMLSNTGIYWDHQCNHHSCSQNSGEGYIIGFDLNNFDFDSEKLCDWNENLDKEMLADEIDSALSKYSDCVIENISVDQERVQEIVEGWVPVLVCLRNDGIFLRHDGLGRKGYLCLPNCD
jgi:hypothetical protein